jgi:CBS domain containing-hemolysin-like protein
VVVATVLSGFFSLTGFALRSFRRAPLEAAFRRAGKPNRISLLAKHLEPLRLTTGLCRAVANLIIVVALVLLFDHEMTVVRAVAAVLVAGAIIAIFGVAIPHAWALHAGEKVLAATLGVLMFFRYALAPVAVVMQAFDFPIRRLAGAPDRDGEDGENAKQEILHAASEGQAEGAVDAEEMQMIESVIEFSDTQAGEIMTPRTDIFALHAV